MDIQTRKLQVIESLLETDDENIIEQLENILENRKLDPAIQKTMEDRALQSEKNIREGRVYTIDQAKTKINQKFRL